MPDRIYDQTINHFLQQAISSSPTPGGGNVAAVAATLAASMVGMVASLTIGKKAYAQYDEQAKEVLKECNLLINQLKELTHQDMAAFDDYMRAFRLPATTEQEKWAKDDALQAASRNATFIPLGICQTCLEVIRQASLIAVFGNRMAVSDAGVGACLGLGALKSAMLSVDVNLKSIIDQEFIKDSCIKRNQLLTEAEELYAATMVAVKQRG